MPRILELKSFLTGSTVYGIPSDKSDVDLVVYLSKDTYYKLTDHTHFNPNNHPSASDEEACPSLRFGKLNIIPVFEPELFAAWLDGTEFLKKEAPVDKKLACEVLEEFRKKAKKQIKARREMESVCKKLKNKTIKLQPQLTEEDL